MFCKASRKQHFLEFKIGIFLYKFFKPLSQTIYLSTIFASIISLQIYNAICKALDMPVVNMFSGHFLLPYEIIQSVHG